MMTQIDLLSKNIMRGGLKLVNVVGTNNGQCPEDAKFKAVYNKEVQYWENQMGGGGGLFSPKETKKTRWEPWLGQGKR
ncbi:hypothetical protein MTR67_035127 [Solanum verrucosum]|uniref:Uncharacterized protein n=1 Tax=Solanum verrucosum TaxID=315347 RepID=A0AAF0U9E5_SOLVR|nr:hypothetical protein MTR67_035127 [Solanum verrucosum]